MPNPEQEEILNPEMVQEVQAEEPETTPAETAIEPATVENVISFKNVSVFQKKLLVLQDISFTVRPGEFVYLIGKTGSGKSSILKSLIAEIRPKGEEANIIGYDLLTLKDKKIPELRKKIGMVFQDYQLVSDMTVIENLMFVLRATRWMPASWTAATPPLPRMDYMSPKRNESGVTPCTNMCWGRMSPMSGTAGMSA